MTQQKENPGRDPGRKSLLDSFNIILPRAEDSEISVLGSIIQKGSLIRKTNLSLDDFYSEKNQIIFGIMRDMERRDVSIDISTLHEEIKKAGKEEKTGGFNYLSYLERLTPSTANVTYHVKVVKETRIKRDLIMGLYSTLEYTTKGGSLESVKAGIAKLLEVSDQNTERPEIKKEAFWGLAGEIVNLISPHSEADPIALLANFHTAFGNVIGDKAHFRVEATQHPMRLFCVLVGNTSKSRKGTSWNYIKVLFKMLDPDWAKNIKAGLSSGEGFIWVVRDAIWKRQPVKEKGRIVDYEEVMIDEGVEDKRLLIVESEFASPLRIMERDGNILSPTIRCAWDTGDLQVLTKNSPAKATNAHVSIIGHTTMQELTRYLSTTEAGNGFGNRFLWLYVKRSKSLPFGGGFHTINHEPIIKKLKKAIEFGKNTEEIIWGDETRPLWEAVYPTLSEGKSGLIEALTARAEAYVTRLACIYALLDLKTEISPEHLRAALAFWEYCEASVKFIFGNSLGVPLVNEIRDALRERSMTRTEIYNYFQRHKSSKQIQDALEVLESEGKATKDPVKTDGRDKTTWRLNET